MRFGEGWEGTVRRYGLAVAFVLGAALLRIALHPLIATHGPFIFFFAAVFASAYYAGFGPGILAIGLSALTTLYILYNPAFGFDVIHREQLVFLGLYVVISFLIVFLTERLRREIELREDAERAVRHGEETFRGIFENARDDAMILMDSDRNILAWNAGAEAICGWLASEMVGQSADKLFTKEDRTVGEPGREAQMAIDTGKALEERWHLRKDGSRFWANGTMTILRHQNGTPRGYLKIFRDETERKRLLVLLEAANEELEQRVAVRTAELELAVRELEGFTYSISHDMRAPLRSMVANCHMLFEDYGNLLPRDGQQHLKRIASSALKMAQLVEDLLIYARLGRAEVNREPCDLGAAAKEVVHPHGDECVLTIDPGSDMTADCDPSLVRMVLQNLIENSCKYRQKGKPAQIKFGRSDDAFYLMDDGIGFDMEYVDKIFLPFERLHRDIDYPGTGIGLANVKRIIDLHGGRVWAESEPGAGAAFYFTLHGPEVIGSP